MVSAQFNFVLVQLLNFKRTQMPNARKPDSRLLTKFTKSKLCEKNDKVCLLGDLFEITQNIHYTVALFIHLDMSSMLQARNTDWSPWPLAYWEYSRPRGIDRTKSTQREKKSIWFFSNLGGRVNLTGTSFSALLHLEQRDFDQPLLLNHH